MNISKEDALKIARISRIEIEDHEIDQILKQLGEVLEYAQRVQALAQDLEDQPSNKNINFLREGLVVPSDREAMLQCAPEREENYFVVPRILDTK